MYFFKLLRNTERTYGSYYIYIYIIYTLVINILILYEVLYIYGGISTHSCEIDYFSYCILLKEYELS